MILDSVFTKWGASIKEFWATMDYNLFWGWFLVVFGLIFLTFLIIFTQYKRKERDSIKFTAIIIVLAAICLAFGFDMILVSSGIW
ncbi:MAG: hypothetical protein ACTSVU_04020 [Promethearchaeota archaeon]